MLSGIWSIVYVLLILLLDLVHIHVVFPMSHGQGYKYLTSKHDKVSLHFYCGCAIARDANS
jgi:hypothetical protein